MKIIDIPTRVYEPGDRVLTIYGPGVVIQDELEDIFDDYGSREKIAGKIKYRNPNSAFHDISIKLDRFSFIQWGREVNVGRHNISIEKTRS